MWRACASRVHPHTRGENFCSNVLQLIRFTPTRHGKIGSVARLRTVRSPPHTPGRLNKSPGPNWSRFTPTRVGRLPHHPYLLSIPVHPTRWGDCLGNNPPRCLPVHPHRGRFCRAGLASAGSGSPTAGEIDTPGCKISSSVHPHTRGILRPTSSIPPPFTPHRGRFSVHV